MPGHSSRYLISVLLCLGLSTGQAIATDRLEHGETDITRLSNEEISKRLENPLTNLWSITFQENYASFEGDAVNGDRKVNTAFFQPALPVPVGEDFDKIFIARPVIPFARRPDFTPDENGGTSGDVAGIGVALIGTIVFMWYTLSPVSPDARMLRYIIPIVPNVRGEVIEVPIEAMTRLQKGGTLFRIDRVPFEITVRQLKAQVAAYEAERRPAEINSAMWLCA